MEAKVNYSTMSEQELKHYMLEHRNDVSAFHAYMDRVYARPQQTVIEPDDPEWEAKVIASIRDQMGSSDSNGNQTQQ